MGFRWPVVGKGHLKGAVKRFISGHLKAKGHCWVGKGDDMMMVVSVLMRESGDVRQTG